MKNTWRRRVDLCFYVCVCVCVCVPVFIQYSMCPPPTPFSIERQASIQQPSQFQIPFQLKLIQEQESLIQNTQILLDFQGLASLLVICSGSFYLSGAWPEELKLHCNAGNSSSLRLDGKPVSQAGVDLVI